jgi:hypothetical protein
MKNRKHKENKQCTIASTIARYILSKNHHDDMIIAIYHFDVTKLSHEIEMSFSRCHY